MEFDKTFSNARVKSRYLALRKYYTISCSSRWENPIFPSATSIRRLANSMTGRRPFKEHQATFHSANEPILRLLFFSRGSQGRRRRAESELLFHPDLFRRQRYAFDCQLWQNYSTTTALLGWPDYPNLWLICIATFPIFEPKWPQDRPIDYAAFFILSNVGGGGGRGGRWGEIEKLIEIPRHPNPTATGENRCAIYSIPTDYVFQGPKPFYS